MRSMKARHWMGSKEGASRTGPFRASLTRRGSRDPHSYYRAGAASIKKVTEVEGWVRGYLGERGRSVP